MGNNKNTNVPKNRRSNRKSKLDPKKQRLKLLSELNGPHEYDCTVEGIKTFENGDKQRGGVLIISAKWDDLVGIVGDIRGYRLWSKSRTGKATFHNPPIMWDTESAIGIRVGRRLFFTYTIIGDGKSGGKTKDIYEINPTGLKIITPGSFQHTSADGRFIQGVVDLRKMANKKDFFYAPRGVKFPS